MRLLIAIVCVLVGAPAWAQPGNNTIGARGFATAGSITFHAQESFDAVLDRHSGTLVGGGAQVLLPWGIYVEIGASQFKQDGERAFVTSSGEVFRLGIPLEITITPLEITGGWRYRGLRRIVPYGGLGYSSYGYRETSDFADPAENVNERFGGFHFVGGAEYQALAWMAIGAELVWASIPDGLGQGGVSRQFNEDDLGGTTVRLKISIGR